MLWIFSSDYCLFYFRLDNEISLYYLGSQGVWKYLWTILSSFFLNEHRRRRNYLSNGYNKGTTAKLTCPKIKMEWINYQKAAQIQFKDTRNTYKDLENSSDEWYFKIKIKFWQDSPSSLA